MKKDETDLRSCTKAFARRVIRLFVVLAKSGHGGAHQTAYRLDHLVERGIVPEDKLATLVQECNELTAILVTNIQRTKVNEQ